MQIYKPTIDEWEILKAIRLEAIEKEPQSFPGKLAKEINLTKETWQDWIGQRKDNALIFAKEEGQIIGLVGFKDMQGVAHIWGLYVDSDYRGNGIGKILLESILEEIKKHGYQEAELTVNAELPRAISLYESFGFSIVEKMTIENVDKYLMRKKIN